MEYWYKDKCPVPKDKAKIKKNAWKLLGIPARQQSQVHRPCCKGVLEKKASKSNVKKRQPKNLDKLERFIEE
ncbi:hypothetical protein C2G38_2169218 [Gigaspora rosea]|uniref:Uncharacterized protein n=1 Tax=Gigaspora rosea TaxID=44941 RepID=A0A397VQK5_9GLOM|nr:hypothetical protein C2G38_2169218 [Gigaspora rosea]CAG8506452.1 12448_t:CDS:2 [Gigaspora rosea]